MLTLIRHFFGTRADTLSILGRILTFPGTRPDSTNFRYSHLFNPIPILARIVFPYSHGFYLFLLLARILLFFGTHTDSTLFRYSPEHSLDTRTDSNFSGYSPRFYYFSVLTLIRPCSGTRPHSFSILPRILPFHATRPDSTIFRYSH